MSWEVSPRDTSLLIKQQIRCSTHLESDGLVGPDEDADPQVVTTHNLCEAGVLGVGQPHPAQLHRHLQPKGSQLPEQRMGRSKYSV